MSSWDLKQALIDSAEALDDLHYCFKDAKSLGRLVSLTSLQRLNVSFNSLASLQGIQSLCNLQHLNVSHNRLTGVDHLSTLHNLTQLNCSHNQICCTSAVANLPGLQFLALHSNKISKALQVVPLSRLTELKHLTLCGNPVCKQQDWQLATLGLLPTLQALDSSIITAEQRAAATGHADTWADAGQQEYSCSTPGDTTCAASEDGSSGSSTGRVSTSSGRHDVCTVSSSNSRSGCGSAGRLRPRVKSGGPGAVLDDSIGIKDVASLLPSMCLQPLKPSSLVRRAPEPHQPSKYGYSRAKPVRPLQKQKYVASGSTAVLIHSDGSASLCWPEGSMAATLDPEEPPPAGSIASSSTSSSSGFPSGSSVAPLKGYRLLAMYRTVTGVAASFDSSGGFVQWPNGNLMLVWNKRDGTAYSPDGRATHNFTSRRKPPGALHEDICAQLDEHLSIRFLAGSHELQLYFTCDGCQAGLSQQHGAILPERAVNRAQKGAAGSMSGGMAAAVQNEQQQQEQQPATPASCTTTAHTAALAGLPGGDEMQALLARARALMAATDLSQPDLPDTGESRGPTSLPGSPAAVDLAEVAEEPAPGRTADAGEDADDLCTMMARARAAVAATTAALQDMAV